MFADPKQTVARRLRRQVKAGVSIVVALAAGAWLSCRPGTTTPGPSPNGPDARVGPQQPRSAPPPPPPPEPDARALAVVDAATDAAEAGDTNDAALVTAGDAARAARAPRVDRHEHRNGMPVRDNLLE